MYCQDHPTAEISHMCREHCAYICIHCLTSSHKHCKDINDILVDDKATEIDTNASLLSDLQSEIKITRKIIKSKKENIENLAMDGRNIEVERKTVIESIITNLRDLEKLSKESTQHMIRKQTTHLEEEVKRFESIEQEQEVNQALANLVLKHGSTRLKGIGVDLIGKRSESLTSKVDQKVTEQEVRLKFDKSTFTVDDTNVGKISVEYRKREEKADQLESSSDELVEKAKEDILKLNQTKQCSAEAESSIPKIHGTVPIKTVCSTKHPSTEPESSITKLDAVPKTTSKSFMKRKISKADEKIKVRTPDDSCTCSITGIIALSNNLLVILDRANSKVKIFKHDFSFVKEHCLTNDKKPIDMCPIDANTLAVIYKDTNLVDIFELQSDSDIKRSFSTWCNVISITCTLDGYLMTLCSKENTEIQLYNTDGYLKRRITKFKDQYGNIPLEKAACIRFTSTNEVFISYKNFVSAFCPGGKSSDTAYENWFYKSHGQQHLKEAGSIATDPEGNIYVCGKKSKNVHQISSVDFWDNRVVVTLATEPLSLLVDNIGCRILIGCENDDYLHIRYFL